MTEGWLPPDTSLDDLKVRIRETYSNPNVRKIHQVVLKEGPQAFRIATSLEVVNRESGNFHHYSLKIEHIDKRRGGWFAKPARSIRLDGDSPDEIERLYRFLHALDQNNLSSESGELHVIRSEDYAKLEKVLEALPNLASTDKLQLVKTILAQFEASSSHVADFVAAFQHSNVETLKHIAVASRMVEYRQAYAKLETLIQDVSTPEKKLQEHLTNNPWMFGSEYSELLPRRSWSRDDRLDYMLRRTVDDFLEIIEIKTPFRDALFIYDDSHDSFFPSSKLSPVLGQVVRYIEEVERARDSILAKDGCDTLKIRARAILGRDGLQHTKSPSIILTPIFTESKSSYLISFFALPQELLLCSKLKKQKAKPQRMTMVTQRSDRSGEQRWFSARRPNQRLVVLRPPPLSVSVGLHDSRSSIILC